VSDRLLRKAGLRSGSACLYADEPTYRPAACLLARPGEVLGTGSPTVCFSGRTYPQLAQIVRELCAVAGRWCSPLVAAVAVSVAVSRGQDAFARLSPGVRLMTARTVEGMAPYPGQARCLALGFWPECFRRLNVKGGQRPFPEETRSALDIEGKHVTIQGPSPDLS
jgi:hypothetical protein